MPSRELFGTTRTRDASAPSSPITSTSVSLPFESSARMSPMALYTSIQRPGSMRPFQRSVSVSVDTPLRESDFGDALAEFLAVESTYASALGDEDESPDAAYAN